MFLNAKCRTKDEWDMADLPANPISTPHKAAVIFELLFDSLGSSLIASKYSLSKSAAPSYQNL